MKILQTENQEEMKILKKVSEEVNKDFIKSPEFERLISGMHSVMSEAGGVGLAAPQVGVNKRIAIITKDITLGIKESFLRILINPRILKYSKDVWTQDEGCLSIFEGRLHVPVTRSVEIRLENTVLQSDGSLKKVYFDVYGFLARVIQHEIDHLDGKLISEAVEEV